MIINHNMSAQFVNRQLQRNERGLQTSIEKLSTGERINRAGDDASGLAVSEKIRSQVRGLQQAMRNAQYGISFLQTAEGSMQEMHSVLHRMRELSVQAANQIYGSDDRMMIQTEMSQLKLEMGRIVDTTAFNNLKILDGSLQQLEFHVGPNQKQSFSVGVEAMDPKALKLDKVGVSTIAQANQSLGSIDYAVNAVSKQRASVGAWQTRMGHVINSLAVARENMTAAESLIRDTDMAQAATEFAKHDIKAKVGISMLVHSNAHAKNVLKLLG